MTAKPRLSQHFTSASGLALCGREVFQSAKSALRAETINPTPVLTADADVVTCKRCRRLLGTLPALDTDFDEEEQFQ